MNKEDFEKFGQILSALSDMYGGKSPSPYVVGIWWNALKDYDFSEVSKALSSHVNNPDSGQFMPKPADVVKAINGSTQDRGFIAWTKLEKAVREVGPYRDVVFDDPLVHVVVTDMGGWIHLSSKTDDEWAFVRNEFVNRYRGYATKADKPAHPPYLIGINNVENAKNGYQTEKPLMLGDKDKALLVISTGIKESARLKKTEANQILLK